MKKRIFIIIIFVWILCFFIFGKENITVIIQNNSKAKTVDEYQLVWPGMLPNNKLYKLKVLRDIMVYKLIISPEKKIEFDLIQADKTLYASHLLVNKGNIELAKETALKGENHMTQLVTDYKWTYWRGEYIPKDLDNRIKLATLKHQRLLDEIIRQVKVEDKKIFEDVKYFSQLNYAEITDLKKGKK